MPPKHRTTDPLRRRRRPDHGVYARLAPSRLHGVGVFAVRAIPRSTYVFAPDDDALVSVRQQDIRQLPRAIRRLYEDFCIRRGRTLLCPVSFNSLRPAWYVNHSDSPNLAADDEYRFYSLRQIRAGEELTIDYSTYSDEA